MAQLWLTMQAKAKWHGALRSVAANSWLPPASAKLALSKAQ